MCESSFCVDDEKLVIQLNSMGQFILNMKKLCSRQVHKVYIEICSRLPSLSLLGAGSVGIFFFFGVG